MKLFEYAESYLKKCTWKDLALLKFCLFSTGLMCGLFVKEDKKKTVFLVAFSVFFTTYIPLMYKFFHVIGCDCDCDCEK